MDAFVKAYITCALWASTTDDGEPLDDNYTVHDLSQEAIETIVDDCLNFQLSNAEDIGSDVEQAGHDFFLTRNHHGCGFWETPDWPKEAGQRLTKAAHACGEQDLYVGDDGKIYVA